MAQEDAASTSDAQAMVPEERTASTSLESYNAAAASTFFPDWLSSSPYFSSRIQLSIEQESNFANKTAFEIECSKSSWTELTDSTSSSADGHERVSNREAFEGLKEHAIWGSFFRRSRFGLEMGEKIAEGGQAEIFAASGTNLVYGTAKDDLVVKVFNEGFSLADLQRLWPPEMAQAAFPYRYFSAVRGGGSGLCWPVDVHLLEDDQFAFVFERHWGDLRKLIDKHMRRCNGALPFSFLTTLRTLLQIAEGMAALHKLGILHRDLKAANVLVIREGALDYARNDGPWVIVADFESSVGTIGTGFWRAPEVLLALKNRSWTEETFTQQTDVYSYAMTCYEVMTGCEPFEGRSWNDYDAVLGGERPALPADDTSPMLLDLVHQCWHEDPRQRPLFPAIVQTLNDLVSSARAQIVPCWVFSGVEKDPHRYLPKNLREFLDHRILENSKRKKDVIIFSFARMLSFMLQIALSMRNMHRLGSLHTSLKSSHVKLTNVLTGNNSGEWKCNSVDVSNFDPSAGAVDAGLWEAPEILLARENGSFNVKTFTAQSDVFSYAMTCYEVITGKVPFECHRPSARDYGRVLRGNKQGSFFWLQNTEGEPLVGVFATNHQPEVLPPYFAARKKNPGNKRPTLPSWLPSPVSRLISQCWHSNPSQRPSFEFILKKLDRLIHCNLQVNL